MSPWYKTQQTCGFIARGLRERTRPVLMVPGLSALVLLLAGTAPAQAVDVHIEARPASEDLLSNYWVNEFLLDFVGQFHGAQLRVDLEDGRIVQHPVGTAAPPSELLVRSVPGIEFDTFVAQGTAITDGSPQEKPQIGGGAVGLGGDPAAQFDTEGINQAWNPAGDVVITDRSDFLLAQVILTDNASGTWGMKLGVGRAGPSRVFGSIANGRAFLDLPGDYDADGVVAQRDLSLVLRNWGKPATPLPSGWHGAGPSGLVSQNELSDILLNWGVTYPPILSAQAIPEPRTMALGLLGALVLCLGSANLSQRRTRPIPQ